MKKLIALILCAAMLISQVGCTREPVETTAAPTDVPTTASPTEPQAVDVYAQAWAELDAASHISLELLITKYTTVAGDAFSEQSVQTLTYQGVGTEDLIIAMDEQMDFSVHSRESGEEESQETMVYKEIWGQGNLYAELDGDYRFSESVDAENAALRYTPVVLLNAELYASITSETTAEGTVIIFAEPTAPESWAVPEEGELLEASGTALVTEGSLKQMTYSVTYLYGTTEITLEVRSEPMDTALDVAIPDDTDAYIPVSCIEAVRMSVSSAALMTQADSIISSSLDSMFCQAAGVLRNQSTVVNLSGRKEETVAKFETGVFFMNYATNESEQYELEETYLDGILTSVEDKGLPTTMDGISWEDIRDYAAEEIIYGLMEMDYWQDVTGTDMGSVYFLEYTLNENFGNTMQNGICDMLWSDPNFLLNLASKYENADLNGYLSVDKYTGIPVAAGFYYKGVHTIEGQDYELTLQYDQSIEAPALGAYKEITEEMPEETEPENKATPLFYHVTGEDGQEMWLLGTIHVGDARTAYLPEEIYNAFTASDALALECNNDAFEEQMEDDDVLSEQVSNLYFYSDGTTVESLIAEYEAAHPENAEDAEETDDAEEDAYAQAVKLMKATGNYNMNMPYAKPYVWSSGIDDFYLRQGYQLHRDQGVEERLHGWAEELDKEIIEVESSLFQVKMLTGFSNDLQLMMLADSMNSSARDSWEGTMDLYEKWCAGDEAILREELSDEVDMTDWTEEEIAEYEEVRHLIDEYNKAMSYDRNDGMLKKAIEYLESGEVIFYAVGLAHLLNDVNGLVDTLREAGYTVELVTYAG